MHLDDAKSLLHASVKLVLVGSKHVIRLGCSWLSGVWVPVVYVKSPLDLS